MLLVVCLILPIITVVPVSASAPLGTMTLLPNTPTDWARARVAGLPSNYFHNETQEHLRATYSLGPGEHTVTFLTGETARADLWRVVVENGEDVFYLWEVKPALHWYVFDLWIEAFEQLSSYVDASSDHRFGDMHIGSGNFPTSCGRYIVSYQNAGNGFIYMLSF